MGFLSGILGGSSSKTEVELPDFIKRLGNSLEPAAMTAMNATPGSQTVAGFSPDQMASFGAGRAIATEDPTNYFGANNRAQEYVSSIFAPPGERRASAFDDQLIQEAMGQFDRNQDIQRAGLERGRMGRRAFGDRAEIARGEEEGQFGRDRSLELSRLLEGSIGRRSTAAAEMDRLAGNERGVAIENMGILGGIGDRYQGQQQRLLDAPFDQVAKINQIVSGAPSNSTQSNQRDPLSTIIGLGAIGAGFFKDGGKVRGVKRYADGGGVGSSKSVDDIIEALRRIDSPTNPEIAKRLAEVLGASEPDPAETEPEDPGFFAKFASDFMDGWNGASQPSPTPLPSPIATAQAAPPDVFEATEPDGKPVSFQELMASAAKPAQPARTGRSQPPVPRANPKRATAQPQTARAAEPPAPGRIAPDADGNGAPDGDLNDILVRLLEGKEKDQPGRAEKFFTNPLTIAGMAILADERGGLASVGSGGLAGVKAVSDQRRGRQRSAAQKQERIIELLKERRQARADAEKEQNRRRERSEDISRDDKKAEAQRAFDERKFMARLKSDEAARASLDRYRTESLKKRPGAKPSDSLDMVTKELLETYSQRLAEESDPLLGDPDAAAEYRRLIAMIMAENSMVEMQP